MCFGVTPVRVASSRPVMEPIALRRHSAGLMEAEAPEREHHIQGPAALARGPQISTRASPPAPRQATLYIGWCHNGIPDAARLASTWQLQAEAA
jgi:hypothetical protein